MSCLNLLSVCRLVIVVDEAYDSGVLKNFDDFMTTDVRATHFFGDWNDSGNFISSKRERNQT